MERMKENEKKLILCAIMAAMAVSPLTSVVSFAEAPAYAAETGELSDYTLEIHKDQTGEWYGDYCFNKETGKITGFNEDVTGAIGNNAFLRCKNISAVEMPVSVKKLGEDIIDDSDVPVVIYYRGTEAEWNAIDIDERESTTAGMSVLFESSIPYSFEISGEPTDQNSATLPEENISEITDIWVEVHKVDNSLDEMTMLMAEYDGNDRLIKANLVPVTFDEDSSVSEIKMPVSFSSDMRKLTFFGIRDMKIVEPVMAQYYIYWVY